MKLFTTIKNALTKCDHYHELVVSNPTVLPYRAPSKPTQFVVTGDGVEDWPEERKQKIIAEEQALERLEGRLFEAGEKARKAVIAARELVQGDLHRLLNEIHTTLANHLDRNRSAVVGTVDEGTLGAVVQAFQGDVAGDACRNVGLPFQLRFLAQFRDEWPAWRENVHRLAGIRQTDSLVKLEGERLEDWLELQGKNDRAFKKLSREAMIRAAKDCGYKVTKYALDNSNVCNEFKRTDGPQARSEGCPGRRRNAELSARRGSGAKAASGPLSKSG